MQVLDRGVGSVGLCLSSSHYLPPATLRWRRVPGGDPDEGGVRSCGGAQHALHMLVDGRPHCFGSGVGAVGLGGVGWLVGVRGGWVAAVGKASG